MLAMGFLLRLDEVFDRRIEEELAKAKTKFGPFNLDLIALETRCGGAQERRRLLRELCFLNLTGRRRMISAAPEHRGGNYRSLRG